MNQRNQFTFYRSYYDALRYLPQAERAEIVLAICAYALDGEQPQGLDGAPASMFTLIKPTLDAARRKAEGGQRGRSGKDTGNKKENEIEIKNENENETETEGKRGVCDEMKQVLEQFRRQIDANPSPSCERELGAFVQKLSAQTVQQAIEIAVDEQRPTWAYLRGILRNYERYGVRARNAPKQLPGQTAANRASPIGKAALDKLFREEAAEGAS